MERPRVTPENLKMVKRASKFAGAAMAALAILEGCSSSSGGYPTAEVIIANEVWHVKEPADGRRYVDAVLMRVNKPDEGQADGIAIIQGDLIPESIIHRKSKLGLVSVGILTPGEEISGVGFTIGGTQGIAFDCPRDLRAYYGPVCYAFESPNYKFMGTNPVIDPK